MAKLVVINHTVAGAAEYELADSWVTIGRADGNAFLVSESSVSSRHCEVKLRGSELIIRDLRSTNGTYIGGQRISEAVLPGGQTFRIGNVEVRFQVAAPAIPKVSLIPSEGSLPLPKAVIPLPGKPEGNNGAGAGGRKYQVLFVDDSMAFLDSFVQLCGELAGGSWQLHTATTADQALSMLQNQTVDLAVVDIGMPMLDGIQLLAILHRRYPDLKVVMMTALTSEENRAACLTHGAELFLEKPTTLEGVKLAFNMLNDMLHWSQQKGFSGALQQVSLPDVIQMECLSGKSAILEVRNGRVFGQIYIESGRVVHANCGELTGEKAFLEVLLLHGGQFQLRPYQQPATFTVSTNWESLLMEASRIRDERAVGMPQTPAPEPMAPAAAAPVAPAPAPSVAPIVIAVPHAEPEFMAPEPVAPEPEPVPFISPVSLVPEPPLPEPPAESRVVISDNIVIMDGDEDKWLMLGGEKTQI